MYRMKKYEVKQYENAEAILKDLQLKHREELEDAYDSISPTQTQVDYDTGRFYVGSVDPSEYAIYLVEMQEKHKKIEKHWILRAEAYKSALKKCAGDKGKIIETLSEIVADIPELQRNHVISEELESLEEYDKRVDGMSDIELYSDYWDLDKYLNHLDERCLYLRNTYALSIKEISKHLGISTKRVNLIIQQK